MKKLLLLLVLVLSTFAGNAQTPVSTITTQEATTDEVKEQIEQCMSVWFNLTVKTQDVQHIAERLIMDEIKTQLLAEIDNVNSALSEIRSMLDSYYITGDYSGFSYDEVMNRLQAIDYQIEDISNKTLKAMKDAEDVLEEWLARCDMLLSKVNELEILIPIVATDEQLKIYVETRLNEARRTVYELLPLIDSARLNGDYSAFDFKEVHERLCDAEYITSELTYLLDVAAKENIGDCLKRCNEYMYQLEILTEKVNLALSNGNQAMNELVSVCEDVHYLLTEIEKNCNEMLNTGFAAETYEMVLKLLDEAAERLDYIEARYVELENNNVAVIEKYIADLNALKAELEGLYHTMEVSLQLGNKHIEQLFPEAVALMDAVDTFTAELVTIIGDGEYDKFNEDEANNRLTESQARFTSLCAMANISFETFDLYMNLKDQIESVKQTMSQVAAFNVSNVDVKSLINDVVAEFASALDIFADKVEKLFLSQALSSEEYKDCMAEIESLMGNSERLLMCVDYISYYNTAFDEYLTNIGKYCPDVKDRFIPEMEACMAEFISYVSKLLREVITDPDAAYNFISRIKDMVSDPYRIYQTAAKAQNEFTGVDGVVVADEADVDYYTLEGRKVANPAAGTVLIRVSSNGNIQKVFVK